MTFRQRRYISIRLELYTTPSLTSERANLLRDLLATVWREMTDEERDKLERHLDTEVVQ